jgi:hypothetical protein
MNPAEKQSLEKQYGSERIRKMERFKQVQRVIMILSILSFFGTSIFGLGKVFKSGFEKKPEATQTTEQQSASALLQKQEKGYEIVLKREPNNPTALEGAIEPLEKLVKLYPDRQDYQNSLTQLKQQNKK